MNNKSQPLFNVEFERFVQQLYYGAYGGNFASFKNMLERPDAYRKLDAEPEETIGQYITRQKMKELRE